MSDPSSVLRIRLLCAPLLTVGDQPVQLRGRLQRTLLQRLAVAAGAVVDRDLLVEALWPDRPPRTAIELLSTHVTRLRSVLAQVADQAQLSLPRSDRGYRLDLDSDEVDVEVDTVQLAAAAGAVDSEPVAESAVAAAHAALGALDVGAATAVPGEPWLTAAVDAAWTDGRAICASLLSQSATAPTQDTWRLLLPRLELMAQRWPFDEAVLAWQIEALARTGRPAEALQVMAETRGRLEVELGASPSAELGAAFSVALELSGPSERTVTPVPRPVHQLPHRPSAFTGRDDELAGLHARLAGSTGPQPTTVMITGPAGVGKSAFALMLADLADDRATDGQLYLDFAGVEAGDPLTSAVSGALTLLGVGVDDQPDRPADLYAMLRSVTADRRLLWLLDNVTVQHPLAALLPTTASATVIVTGCALHPDLLTADRCELDPLDASTSIELLGRVAGTDRLSAEPAATLRLVQQCEGLPAALLASARRLLATPHRSVADLVRVLDDGGRRLAEFSTGSHGVGDALDDSRSTLTDRVAHGLAALGVLPSDDCDPELVAVALDCSVAEARHLLEELVQARLVTADAGAYLVGGLVREYAWRLWEETHDADATLAARERLERVVAASESTVIPITRRAHA